MVSKLCFACPYFNYYFRILSSCWFWTLTIAILNFHKGQAILIKDCWRLSCVVCLAVTHVCGLAECAVCFRAKSNRDSRRHVLVWSTQSASDASKCHVIILRACCCWKNTKIKILSLNFIKDNYKNKLICYKLMMIKNKSFQSVINFEKAQLTQVQCVYSKTQMLLSIKKKGKHQ